MTRKLVVCLALIVMAHGCGRSVGAEADPGFAALDANNDGKVSLEESRMAQLAFLAADRNGDGFLDVLEWEATGDASGIVAARQRDKEDQRDVMDPHRTGSTMRGASN